MSRRTKSNITGSKKRSRSTQRPSLLAAANATIARLLDQLAEKDAQIRMVLEERFYHPVQPARNTGVRSTVVMRPEDVEDVVQFPVEGDRKAISVEENAAGEAERRLAAQLDEEVKEIVAEQEAAHAGEEAKAPEPVEMLKRVAAVAEPMTKAERSKEAARQIAEAQP